MSQKSKDPGPSLAPGHVGPGTVVTLSYEIHSRDGHPIEGGSKASFDWVFGRDPLLPGVERRLEGLRAGDRVSLRLRPEEAFGYGDPSAIIEVDRAEFPAGVAPGDRFEAENERGEIVVLKLLEVGPDRVVADTNHPLAGQELRLELHIHAVRPASIGELKRGAEVLDSAASLCMPSSAQGQLVMNNGHGKRRLAISGESRPATDEPYGELPHADTQMIKVMRETESEDESF